VHSRIALLKTVREQQKQVPIVPKKRWNLLAEVAHQLFKAVVLKLRNLRRAKTVFFQVLKANPVNLSLETVDFVICAAEVHS
jgi:hypothetical protein